MGNLRAPYLVACLGIISLLILSAFYYRERMLFIDPIFYAFNILNQNHLLILQYRFGSFITQLAPLIGGKVNLSLDTLLLVYSTWFYLFYGLVVYLTGHKFKQYGLAILLVLYFFLFVSDGFFWPINDVHQGIAWMTLGLGALTCRPTRYQWFQHLTAAISCFLALFNHMLVVLPFGFLWVYLWLHDRRWNLTLRSFWLYSAFFATIFLVRYKISAKDWYEGDKLRSVSEFSFEKMTAALTGPHAQSFGNLLWTNYWLVAPICLAGAWALIRLRRYDLLALTGLSAMVYFVLMTMTFGGFGRELRFYMESEWMGLGIILSAPFVFSVLPTLSNARSAGILGAILLIRLLYIGQGIPLFVHRLEYLEKVLHRMQEKNLTKLALVQDGPSEQITLMNWGLPVETMALSSLNGERPNRTFLILKEQDLGRIHQSLDTMISCFNVLHPRILNPEYFSLDTSQTYQIMTMADFWGR